LKPSRLGPELGIWDWLIVLACLGAGLAGLKLMSNARYWNEKIYGESAWIQIGTLQRDQGAVRHKPNGSIAWRDIETGKQPVAAGDTVFTGDDGIAKIILDEGASATVLPNSLVMIEQSRKPAEPSAAKWVQDLAGSFTQKVPQRFIDVKKGQMNVRLKTGSGIKVRSNKSQYQIESVSKESSIEISVDPSDSGTLKIAADSASEVKLTAGSQKAPLLISKSQTAVLLAEEAMIQRTSLKNVAPGDGAAFFSSDKDAKHPVTFTWTATGDIPRDSRFRIEFSGARNGSEDLPDLEARSATFNLSPGTYARRAVLAPSSRADAMKQPITTGWRTFRIVPLVTPEIIGPSNEAVLPALSKKQRLSLTWNELPIGLKAEVELTNEQATPVVFISESRSQLDLELTSGQYGWRVRSLAKHGTSQGTSQGTSPETSNEKRSGWSRPYRFTIGELDPDFPPVKPSSPSPLPSSTPSAAPSLLPQAVPKPLPKQKSKTSNARQLIPTVKFSADAAPRSLSVKNTSISTRLVSERNLEKIPVQLAWQGFSDAVNYEVTVRKGNETVFERTVTKPMASLNINSLTENDYSYQISATLRSGDIIRSRPMELNIEHSAPLLKSPSDREQFTDKVDVLLTWEKTLLTRGYQLQIAKDSGFSDVVFDQAIPENFYSIAARTPGTFFWRVRGVYRNRESPWSSSKSFTIRGTIR